MSARSLFLLILSGVIAVGTAVTVRNHIVTDSKASYSGDVVRVLVASTDIAPGSFIRGEDQLQWVEWPEQNLNESYIREGMEERESFSGSVARRQLLKGEPVTESLLIHADEGGFMAAVLGPNKRAVSIAVDSTTGNAGFIFPGDRVDLILTHSIPVENGEQKSKEDLLASETFIEDVRVLAVDQQLDNPDNQAILAKTVTLEVSKQQAEKVNVARDLGKISLSLRSLAQNEDGAELASSEGLGVTPHATRDSDVSAVLTPHNYKQIRKVTVIRGAERQELQFGQ